MASVEIHEPLCLDKGCVARATRKVKSTVRIKGWTPTEDGGSEALFCTKGANAAGRMAHDLEKAPKALESTATEPQGGQVVEHARR